MCLQEKQGHFLCSCRTFSSRQAVNLDYLHYLRQALLSPLQKHGTEGAGQAVQLLDDYQLVKEDVDSIMEISVWGGQPDPYSKLDSKVSIKETYLRMWLKPTEELVLFFFSPLLIFFLLTQVKAAFTRAYNKEVHLTPYSLQIVKKSRRGGGESELGGEDNGHEESEGEDNLKVDAMIKVSTHTSNFIFQTHFSIDISCHSYFHLLCPCSRRRLRLQRSQRRKRKSLGRAKERAKAKLRNEEKLFFFFPAAA